jgi:hypothetical protein
MTVSPPIKTILQKKKKKKKESCFFQAPSCKKARATPELVEGGVYLPFLFCQSGAYFCDLFFLFFL